MLIEAAMTIMTIIIMIMTIIIMIMTIIIIIMTIMIRNYYKQMANSNHIISISKRISNFNSITMIKIMIKIVIKIIIMIMPNKHNLHRHNIHKLNNKSWLSRKD